MNRKNIFTAGGILLSFVIAIGGWVLTRSLIEIKSDRLFLNTWSITTNVLDTMLGDTDDSTISSEDIPFNQISLSEDRVASILKSWESSLRETPHEPTKEQLSMEQAIEAARQGLSILQDRGIVTDEMLVFQTPLRAALAQNISYEGEFLPAEYSYWNVIFLNEYLHVTVTVNAVTGQAWKIYVSTVYKTTDQDFENIVMSANDEQIQNILDGFMQYLELDYKEVSTKMISTMSEINENTFMLFSVLSRKWENEDSTLLPEDFINLESINNKYFYEFSEGSATANISLTGILLSNGDMYFNQLDIFLAAQFP